MSNRKKYILGFFLLLVLGALYVSLMPGGETAVTTTNQNANLPTYGVRGPSPVGKRELVLGGETPLEMKIWYPALPDTTLEATANPYEVKLFEPVGTIKLSTSTSQAAQDASFDLANGPYPLVILSPGFSMGSTAYGWLAEHLASYGFVVISPEHQEYLDPENELWQSAIERPQDILAVFATVDAAVEPGGMLEGLIDPEVAAVVGHSYGGYTALAAAGAQIDTASFKGHCAEAAQANDPAVWLCDMLIPHLPEMAELAGFDAVPEGLWPDWSDPRVDAIVPMAGDAFFFGEVGLAKIDVPVLAIGGTLDKDTPFSWGPGPAYEHASGPAKAQVALTDAEHMIFTDTCESIRWYAKPLAGEFCADSVWDRNQAHDLVNHFTTAFLLAELKQDATATAVLAPGAVDFPNISYQAEGY